MWNQHKIFFSRYLTIYTVHKLLKDLRLRDKYHTRAQITVYKERFGDIFY